MSRLDKELSRLYVYASMVADEDSRLSEPQGMQQEMQNLYASFGAQAVVRRARTAARGGPDRSRASWPPNRGWRPFAFLLRDVVRRAAHTLSDAEEKLLADASPLASSATNIYTILSNADFPYPTITTSSGETVKVDQAGYTALRASANRDDRKAAMSTFFGALGNFSRTFGTTINSSVQKALFYSRAKKYGSNLEAALDGPNIPVSVYMRLIEGVNPHLPTFHRYLKLRRRVMGLPDELHYYDLYAPLVSSVELRYTPEEAQAHVVSAMRPLGADYTGVLERGFRDRWLDWYPTEGKVSGAYSNGGAYDVHPYILLNYLGQYNDVSTLAHELGHTMHSYYSNKVQPYADGELHDVRRRSGLHLQRGAAHRSRAEADRRRARRGCRCSATFSRASSPPCSGRRSSPSSSCGCTRWGRKGSRSPASRSCSLYLDICRRYYGHAAACAWWTTSSSTSGASSRTSTASSTCSSTPRRSAPPRRCRRRCWRATRPRATAT